MLPSFFFSLIYLVQYYIDTLLEPLIYLFLVLDNLVVTVTNNIMLHLMNWEYIALLNPHCLLVC